MRNSTAGSIPASPILWPKFHSRKLKAMILAALNQDSLRTQGYDDALKKEAASFPGKAKELEVRQRQIAAAYAVAPSDIRKRVARLIPQYNKDLRAAAKTVIMGTRYLDGDIPAYQVPYYQEIPGKLSQTMESLKKGDGKAVEEDTAMWQKAEKNSPWSWQTG